MPLQLWGVDSQHSYLRGRQSLLLCLASTPVKQLSQRARAQVHHRACAWRHSLGANVAAILGSSLNVLSLLLGSLDGLGLLQLLQLHSRCRASAKSVSAREQSASRLECVIAWHC